jgi:hypothetical protein
VKIYRAGRPSRSTEKRMELHDQFAELNLLSLVAKAKSA